MNMSLIQALCPSPSRLVQGIIRREDFKTGLDIGCGAVSILTPLRRAGFVSTGIDVSQAMLEKSRAAGAHDEYILGEFLSWNTERRFDVIVLADVIEHFPREAGEQVLNKVEAMADKLIYVETPNGFLEQPALDGNPYQRHLSGWNILDFKERGYEVYGVGIKGLRGPVGRPLFDMERTVRFLERMSRWYMFRRPGRAYVLGAVKRCER